MMANDHKHRHLLLTNIVWAIALQIQSLHVNFGSVVLLPQRCSLIINGDACGRSPSFIVSVNDKNDQYMIGVVCEEHMKQMEKQLQSMQEIGKVPKGSIH